jgi:succinate dehydrogenase / fumarate reductase cytochrome b subunit
LPERVYAALDGAVLAAARRRKLRLETAMSIRATETLEPPQQRATGSGLFWHNSIGVKAAMSVTGMVLALFLVEHVAGNLLIYRGRDTINGFAAALASPALLWLIWIIRVILIVAFLIHAISGIALYLEKRRARPEAYQQRSYVEASIASRTMIWSGLAIFAFVVYHLLHLAFGVVHPRFRGIDDVYDNVVSGLRVAGSSAAYLAAMIALGFHLWHGLYSMISSLGWREPRFVPAVRSGAAIVGTIIALAFASIPIAVLAGLVG